MTTPEFVLPPERAHRSGTSSSSKKRRRRRIFHAIFWPLLALVVIGGGFAAWWLGTSALQVRDDLEAARDSVSQFQAAAVERRFDELQPIADDLSASAASAVEPTGNPIWRMAEVVPGAGENLRAVRIIAEGVDEVSREIVQPTVGLTGSFGIVRDPATGALDLGPLREATEVAGTAERVVTDLQEQLASVDTSATISQVSDAVQQFEGVVASAGESLPGINAALAGAGAMLGVDGPRTVLLAFENNAEATALGGGPAAQTLLRVDNGTIVIDRQVSSTELDTQAPVSANVDPSALQLYDDILFTEINGTTSRPDFPTAAQLIRARWERDLGIVPDTVVMTDPLAVSRLLQVTGPVAMPDGDQLTSDNVVSKLLNEIYFRYPEGGAESDAYFAAASAATFDRLMSGDYDVWAMAQALIDVTNSGSLMMWTTDETTQALFDDTRLDGTLPAGNEGATVVGVYFRDRSISKIDYYLHSEATVTTNACTPDQPTYTVETRLRFDIPTDIELPEYIDAREPGRYRTEVFLYGPVGGSTTAVEVPEPANGTTTGPSVIDLGRPAEKFTVDMENGQTALVRATFAGVPGQYGPTEVRTTPMINPTKVTLQDAAC